MHEYTGPNLTEEQKKKIQGLALQVWDYIAGDLFTALAEEGKRSLPRSHVLEMVFDANRMEERAHQHFSYGTDRSKDVLNPRYADVIEFIRTANQEQMDAVLKPAFPFARYSA